MTVFHESCRLDVLQEGKSTLAVVTWLDGSRGKEFLHRAVGPKERRLFRNAPMESRPVGGNSDKFQLLIEAVG